jgi:hypothetical protein
MSFRKKHPRVGRFDKILDLELSLDVTSLERACCAQLQARGDKLTGLPELANPITMKDAPQPNPERWVDLPSVQVYRNLDQELSKAHGKFLRGQGATFSVVPVDVRTRTGRQ